MKNLESIISQTNAKRTQNGQFVGHCPAHDDQTPSLSISAKDGQVLVNCFAGCSQESVWNKLVQTNEKKANHRELTKAEGEVIIKNYFCGHRKLSPSVLGKLSSLNAKNSNYSKEVCITVPMLDWSTGEQTARQDIHVEPSGKNIIYEGKNKKRIHGKIQNNFPVIGSLNSKEWNICEGYETALAIADVISGTVICSLGLQNFKKIDIPSGKIVHIWSDNDINKNGQKAATFLAVELFKKHEVFLHIPHLEGHDWLDIYLSDKAIILEEYSSRPSFELSVNDTNVANSTSYQTVQLMNLLNQSFEQRTPLVEGFLKEGEISLLAAKPKVGKSHLARFFALKVSIGENFFEKKVTQGNVIYLALEEVPAEVQKHFLDMGATGHENITVVFETPREDILEGLELLVSLHEAKLVIIDTLFLFRQVKDVNDYMRVTQAIAPIRNVARKTGCHFMLVHHAKKGESEGIDSALGSTSIVAAMDTIMMLERKEHQRYLTVTQRYGDDLDKTELNYDETSRTFTLGKTASEVSTKDLSSSILEFLAKFESPKSITEIKKAIVGKSLNISAALNYLLKMKKIDHVGKGSKGDPKLYFIAQ